MVASQVALSAGGEAPAYCALFSHRTSEKDVQSCPKHRKPDTRFWPIQAGWIRARGEIGFQLPEPVAGVHSNGPRRVQACPRSPAEAAGERLHTQLALHLMTFHRNVEFSGGCCFFGLWNEIFQKIQNTAHKNVLFGFLLQSWVYHICNQNFKD